MTWWPFIASQWAWLFLLFIPLIIFYFLKLKRPRHVIPSLALWRSVLNDQRVNSPFQKFKRNLLLLLQLLLLFCLVVAAMQPFFPSGADRAKYLPVLIDTSASMAAVDHGGKSRLDLAKEEIRRLIDNLLPEQRLCLISVSSTARQLTDFTDNQRVLRDALEQVQVSQVSSRLDDALRMTQALARTFPIETAVLYTDGNVPPEIDFELPFQLNYQKLDPAGRNIGITAVNARRVNDRWDVFVRIEGSKGESDTDETPINAEVILQTAGRDPVSESISLTPGQSQRIVFPIEGEGARRLEVQLKPLDFDALAMDNVASLDLPAGRPLAVYCATELESYRHALRGIKDVLLYPSDDDDSKAASYDLVLTDSKTDLDLEAETFIFIGVVPDDLSKLIRVDDAVGQVIDWQRNAPLLQHVLLTDLQLADRPVSLEGVRDRDFEELGYEILIQGRSGPLLVRKEAGERALYYFLFHTDHSTLPFRVGFPILVSNSVQLAQQRAGLSEVIANQTGILPPLHLQPEKEYQVQGPDGNVSKVRSSVDGTLSGISAPLNGRYSIRDGGTELASVGVSLLSVAESSLGTVDQLQFRELKVGAASTLLKSDRPIWHWFAVVGFVLLLAEWWYFQRRPGGILAT
ncbi:MAG: BatA and WFA domain-containing protein [Planctomycetes bacterium]|nr:BatA and WFA domain-containing protein [Planctomycetota bacterium]